jgi:predicted NUDIX family NTP pyrophosphohydrolase
MGRRSETSAGLVAFRRRDGLEVLLAHPGGPFWTKRDNGAWTIPKGRIDAGSDLLGTARREFAEETGLAAEGEFVPLRPVRQKSGKLVHAWAIEADFDLTRFSSNSFELEWPPRSGRHQNFPEIDRIAYFAYPIALEKIIAYQQPFLLELEKKIRSAGAS